MFEAVPLILLIGGSLILVGLVGGGLEVREFRLPKISNPIRILSVVLGIGLIGGGMLIGYQEKLVSLEAQREKDHIQKEIVKSLEEIKLEAKQKGQETLVGTERRVKRSIQELDAAGEKVAKQAVKTAFDVEKRAAQDVIQADLEVEIASIRADLNKRLEEKTIEKEGLEEEYKRRLVTALEESEQKWEAKLREVESKTRALIEEAKKESPQAPLPRSESMSGVAAPNPHGMIKKYFTYVGNRDADAAVAMWKSLSPARRNQLRGIIEGSEYVSLHREQVEDRGNDWAVISFRLTSKPQRGSPQEWEGAFELQFVDGDWKITRQTRADQIR